MKKPRITLLLDLLDEAYDRRSWHGPVLKGALRGVTAKRAAWRPAPGRNSIRDLAYHCAYWKYCAREFLIREARRHKLAGKGPAFSPCEAFARSPANFPARDEAVTETQWKADLRLLEKEHRKLRRTIAALPEALLDKRGGKARIKVSELCHGVAAHDLYHCGQICYLKRLQA